MKYLLNEGRDLYKELDGKKYARYPIETHFLGFDDKLEDVIEKYAAPQLQDGDILCISCKIVSITKGLVVHKDDVRISPLARLIVKFVRKWPNDIGYSNPRKMQVAINTAGYPRIIAALIGGVFMKALGKPGYFYKIAGNQINAIDGFTVGYTQKPIFEEYAFLPPKPKVAKELCNNLASEFGVHVAILDGNNIENNIMGTSDSLDKFYTEQKLKEILAGNPQGQEDDNNNTPILIVREEN